MATGTSEGPLTSAQTAAVTNVNDTPVGVPTITGTVTEDQILTADTSGISDADGLGAFSYQWLRDGVAIGGATAGTYTLGRCRCRRTDQCRGELHRWQRAPARDRSRRRRRPRSPTSTMTPVGVPTITGTVTEDQILTADTSGISDADGLGAFSYQWLRDGVAIGGATAGTYTLGRCRRRRHRFSVEVSYTDGDGTSEGPLTSADSGRSPTSTMTPVGVPTITGTVTEDQILTADTSGISDADGLGAFSYQWLRDGVAIGGATAGTYTLGRCRCRHQISVSK